MSSLKSSSKRARPGHPRQHGIALLEAMVAIIILGIGLLGAVGMQARAIGALNDAGLRAEATLAADKLAGIMQTDPANLANYALAAGATPHARLLPWYNETRAAIPAATVTIAVTPVGATSTRADLSISWQRKRGERSNSHQVSFYLAPSI